MSGGGRTWRAVAAAWAPAALLALAGCTGTPGPGSLEARMVRQGLSSREPQELDVSDHFAGLDGCMVLRELSSGETRRYRPAACAERAEPCSSFKILNALIGLQTGVLQDEHTLLHWDGTPQSRPALEQDHTIATAVRDSALWYFQRVAEAVGQGRMRFWLERTGYGNADSSSGQTSFWLRPGSLRISADEQAEFLARLYRDELPFDGRVTDTVRRVLVLRDDGGVTLSGKTGTGGQPDASASGGQRAVLGWFVGDLRTPDGEWTFATRITGTEGSTGQRARQVTEAVLRDVGLMP